MNRCFLALSIAFFVSSFLCAEEPKSAEILVKSLVIPEVKFKANSGLEVLEFLRLKAWTTSVIDLDSRIAHEYKCNPNRLFFGTVKLKLKNTSYGEVLSEVCRQLSIKWMAKGNKVVFEDKEPPKNEASPGVPFEPF